MNTAGILLGSIAGTLGMSLYGAFVPTICLSGFQTTFINLLVGKSKSLLSLLLHYVVALAFTIFYDWLWQRPNFGPSILSGLILGLINGMIAILLVSVFFERAADGFYRRRFFFHVMVAHGVFGISTTIGYNLTNN
jgi:hypothetical protein